MGEEAWWELAFEDLRDAPPGERAALVEDMVRDYRQSVRPPTRPEPEVRALLADMLARLAGGRSPYMVISAPEAEGLTPDDLVLEPAWNDADIERLWDLHDGRNLGTMIVAVYRLDSGQGIYIRDTRWGVLGDGRKTGPQSGEVFE
jgi:hypothetical protein